MAASEKLDLYKQHKAEYVQAKKPTLVPVGSVPYLAIDGQGDPGSEEFQACVGALYGMAFTIKMTRKFAGLGDYKVCHLEGWYGHSKKYACLTEVPRAEWLWTLAIRVPEFIASADLAAACRTLLAKGKGEAVKRVRLETIDEGLCVQMLHVGPYAAEPETIARMAEFVTAEGLTFHGRHHEIYISDPRRVKPEKLKTILRFPVRRK